MDDEDVLCYFVMIGYLTFSDNEVFIPNLEIREEWEILIQRIFNKGSFDSVIDFYTQFYSILKSFHVVKIREELEKIMEDLSSRSNWREYYYQMLLHGICLPLRNDKNVKIRSEGGSARGFSDIEISFKNEKRSLNGEN